MNTQLVKSITQIIESLTPDEKDFLRQKIQSIFSQTEIAKPSHFQEAASPQEME